VTKAVNRSLEMVKYLNVGPVGEGADTGIYVISDDTMNILHQIRVSSQGCKILFYEARMVREG